jgi:hypothetical protein
MKKKPQKKILTKVAKPKMEKREPLQQMLLGKLDIYMQKTEMIHVCHPL